MTGCPQCAGNIPWNYERFLKTITDFNRKEYDYTKINPKDIFNAYSQITIICTICRCEWRTTINDHINGKHGCPQCRSSRGEKECSRYLDFFKIKYYPQFRISSYRYDFMFVHNEINYVLEFDGIQHFEYTPYFHNSRETFEKCQMVDITKTIIALDQGFKVLRIDYNNIYNIEEHLRMGLDSTTYLYVSDENLYRYIIDALNK